MESILMPFCISAFITIILVPLVINLAKKIGALDIPKDNRRMHKIPMPLMGGLAIYIGVVISMLIFLPITIPLLSVIVAGSLVVISGIIDDIKDISPKFKLLFQLLASIVLIIGGVRITFITNPFSNSQQLFNLGWLSAPISLIWIIGITNTLNLIDGLDGLAAGIALISSLSLLVVAYSLGYTNTMVLSAILAGACLGFLPFNFRPARIFMGDTGALFIGFMLAVISIEGVMKSVATISMVVPIFVLGLPILDTLFAICRRLLSGKSIVVGDKSHIHHRLVARGLSHRDTVWVLYSISIIFGVFSVLMAKANSNKAVIISLSLFLIGIILAMRSDLFNNN